MITDTKTSLRLKLLPLGILLVITGSLYFSACGTTFTRREQSDSSTADKQRGTEIAKRSSAEAASELESDSGTDTPNFQAPVATGPAPQWVKSRPFEPGFFYGIGRAKRDSQKEEPMAVARSRALSDLASQLSAEVEENVYIEQSESTDGESVSFVRMETNTVVETHLPELDEVKSYRAEDGTVWYLVGLSYNNWQNWLNPEQKETRQRVIDTVRYSSKASYGERLQKIRNALVTLQEAPFSSEMQGSLWGEQGNLEALLRN